MKNMQGDQDSDQSISDEEELQSSFPENGIFRGEASENKAGLQLPSKLEALKRTNELNCRKKQPLPKKQMRFNLDLEDEVEMPFSDDEDDFFHSPRKGSPLCSDEEIISDEEENAKFPNMNRYANSKFFDIDVGNQKQVEAQWCSVNKETEALVRLNEKASCSSSVSAYSKSNKHGKGGKLKPKFSFRFQSNKGELSCGVLSNEGVIVASKDQTDVLDKVHEVLEHNIVEQSAHERYGDLQEEQIEEFEMCKFPGESESHGNNNYTERSMAEQSAHERYDNLQEEEEQIDEFEMCKLPGEPDSHGHNNYAEHSMAELLDGLQDNTDLLGENPESCRLTNRITERLLNISSSTLGDFADNDSLEAIGNETSSTDEEKEHKPKLVISEHKAQTMADRFQDALGAACLNNEDTSLAAPRTSFAGLFGKLQKVIQTEKETDAEFLKNLLSGPNDGTSWIDVQIISKYLDAKLTVCHCHLRKSREGLEHTWSPQTMENNGNDVTVIFNSRLCNDVELEVGNSIRIHVPWKEVAAMSGDKDVILSTYYSLIST